jgi:hypothetical protein
MKVFKKVGKCLADEGSKGGSEHDPGQGEGLYISPEPRKAFEVVERGRF